MKELLLKALELPQAERYRLAFLIAESLDYTLKPEPPADELVKIAPRGGVEYDWQEWSLIYRKRLRALMKLICNEGYAVSSDGDGMPYRLYRTRPSPSDSRT